MRARAGSREHVVLLADDPGRYGDLAALADKRRTVQVVSTLRDALATLLYAFVDVVIVEYEMRWRIGVSLLDDLRARHPGIRRLITGAERHSADLHRLVAIGVAHRFVPREELVRALRGNAA